MKKQEFLSLLKKRLSSLPKKEIEERVSFYSEMIDDRMEDGMSENEAVRDIGGPELVSSEVLKITPKKQRGKIKREKKETNLTLILLLALGFPIWLPLLISGFAVIVSLYATLWSLLVSLWAVFISLAVSAPAGLIIGLINIFSGNGAVGAITVGGSFVAAGIAVFLYFGCIAATRGMLSLTRKTAESAKNLFTKSGARK